MTTGTELRTRLHAIASNLVWVWRPALRDFLASISPADADFIHNPVAGLQALGDEQLAALDADKAFQNAKDNTPHTARMAHDQALGKVMQILLKDDTQVYKQFVENESFRRFVGDMVYQMTSQ